MSSSPIIQIVLFYRSNDKRFMIREHLFVVVVVVCSVHTKLKTLCVICMFGVFENVCRNSRCECFCFVHWYRKSLDCDLREMTFTSIMTVHNLDTKRQQQQKRQQQRKKTHTH